MSTLLCDITSRHDEVDIVQNVSELIFSNFIMSSYWLSRKIIPNKHMVGYPLRPSLHPCKIVYICYISVKLALYVVIEGCKSSLNV